MEASANRSRRKRYVGTADMRRRAGTGVEEIIRTERQSCLTMRPKNSVVKDLFGGESNRPAPSRRQPNASSESLSGKSKILPFRRSSGDDGPQTPDPIPHHGPRLLRSDSVLDCVAIDMGRRWYDYETSIVTIRRKLNVSIPEAERIVRRGMKLRALQARKAA